MGGGIAFGQPRGIMKQRLHGIAFTHNTVEVANLRCLGNRHTLALQYAKYRFAHGVQIQRLGQEIIGAQPLSAFHRPGRWWPKAVITIMPSSLPSWRSCWSSWIPLMPGKRTSVMISDTAV